jgi:hypothetical protein
MIQTSLTWGDALVEVLIGLGVAFAAFLFSSLYRRAAPVVSDYWAGHSIRAARNQLARLNGSLADYEADFADHRLFFGRIIFSALSPLIFLLSCILVVVVAMSYYVAARIHCELHNSCLDGYREIFSSAPELYEYRATALLLIIAIVFEMLFFWAMARLRLEMSPQKYRARLEGRISRIRGRLPEG